MLDLRDRSDAAVDGEDEVETFLRQAGERVCVQAVAFFEARRQMPRDVGLQFAQQEDGERSGADPVGVVVAVHADSLAGVDRCGDRRDRLAHVAECERVVSGQGAVEEAARFGGLVVAAADEHRSRHLVERERVGERLHTGVRTGLELPGSGRHVSATVRTPSDRTSWKLVELRPWCSGRSPRSSPLQDWPARPPPPRSRPP